MRRVDLLLAAPDAGEADDVPPAYRRFIRWTPVLWLGGILSACSLVVLLWLTLQRWPRGLRINLVVAAWLAVALAQAISALLNGIAIGDIGLGLRNLSSFAVIGWAFGALAIAAGGAWRLSGERAAYWVAQLGVYTLALAAVALAARLAGAAELYLTTPLTALFPNSKFIQFYASAAFFQREETLGEVTTRLILFYPWAPALGIGSVAVGLISSRAADWRWRWAGMVGSLVGVVFSWSRLAIAAAAGVTLVLAFLRLPRWARLGSLAALCTALWLMSAVDIDAFDEVGQARAAADQTRSGSSMARQLIYEKSWEGFLRSPLIGHGWIGESVHRTEMLPIGSHSTFYGVLYTGGVATFTCFVAAMALTLGAIVRSAGRAASSDARGDAAIALGLWLLLVMCSPYESIFSLTLPCLPLFTWIGGVIGAADEAPAAAPARRQMRRFEPRSPGDADASPPFRNLKGHP